jgi:hypothetical protein
MMIARGFTAIALLATVPAMTAAQTTDPSRTVVSGFVGSNFGNNASPASPDFGGSIAYLLRNTYGLEFEAGFTPNFELQSKFFGLGVTPQVNSFMGNVIFAKSVGPKQQFQPFVSGGVGALSLRSGLTTADGFDGTLDSNDTRFGGNVGGGFMVFSGRIGLKADVRYYRASGSYNTSVPAAGAGSAGTGTGGSTSPSPVPGPGPYGSQTIQSNGVSGPTTFETLPAGYDVATANSLPSAALSGLHFWRTNVGLALRW